MDILSGKKVVKMLVESAHAVARSATVAEQAWKMAKENGVQIVAADIPALFKANANPGETLMRRVTFAVQAFERDMIVQRLHAGLMEKKAESSEVTQKGRIKYNSRKSTLQTIRLTKAQKRRALCLVSGHAAGQFGWRVLAARLSACLRLPVPMTHETAPRMAAELFAKQG